MKNICILSVLTAFTLSAYSSAFSRNRLDAPANSDAYRSLVSKADSLPTTAPVIYIPMRHRKPTSNQDIAQLKKGSSSKTTPVSLLSAKKSRLSKALAKSAKTQNTSTPSQKYLVEENARQVKKSSGPNTEFAVESLEKAKKQTQLTQQKSKKTTRQTHSSVPVYKAKPVKTVQINPSIASANAKTTVKSNSSFYSQEANAKQTEEEASRLQNRLAKRAIPVKHSEKAPLDGGVVVLLAAGAAAGVRKAYIKRRESGEKQS